MIEFLTLLPIAIGVVYVWMKIDEWYAQSSFLVEKAKRMEAGQDWDQKEF